LLAFSNLSHTLIGLYIWEFATTLDYEWSIIWGRRPYRWTIWIYSFTRLAALVVVTLAIVDYNTHAPFSCQAMITLYSIFACLAIATAELLIVLRIVAIWNRQMVAVATAIVIWAINMTFIIQAMSRLGSDPLESNYCLPRSIQISELHGTSILVTGILSLLMMLFGLLRLHIQEVDAPALGHLMWKQGINWFFIATIAEVIPVAFVSLDLHSNTGRIMFQVPSLVMISIAATRIYRLVAGFVFELVDGTQETLQGGICPTSKLIQNPGQIPPKRLEVSVSLTRVQYPTTRTSDTGSDTDGPVTQVERID